MSPGRLSRRIWLGAAAWGPWVHGRAQAVERVVYPAMESPRDLRFADMVALLRAALERTVATHGPFDMQPSLQFMTQPRQLLELERGHNLRVQWSATTIEKEQRLLPVRFPTRRGLLGFRLALIRRDRQPEFSKVRSLADLQRFVIGQGSTWVDTDILRSQGLTVSGGHYEGLFAMLTNRRIDLFPRGLNEVFTELEARAADMPELAVEDSFALHYPMPYYFFFNRADGKLAERVEKGLLAMAKDGSFERHFWRHHGAAVRAARLHERRLIRLQNPLLPPQTPLQHQALWFDPERMPAP